MASTFSTISTRRRGRWALIPATAVALAVAGCTVPPPPPVTHAPRGSFDTLTGTVTPQLGVRVAGWVDDQDAPGAANVKITVDNVATVAAANTDRADVAGAIAGAKLRSGFNIFVPTTPGPHNVCVWAANTGGAEPDTFLGCKTAGVGYTFIVPPVNGTPVRWSGAAPINYMTRTASAYPEALTDIQAALASITAETGLTFNYLGNNDTLIPTLDYGKNGTDPLLIGWVNAAESNLFTGAPSSVVGVAGSYYTSSGRFVSGRVALEKNRLASLPRTGNYSKMTVILHELAHAFGLGHVDDTTQIMNPFVVNLSTWGAGDKLGLDAVSPPPGAPVMHAAEAHADDAVHAGPIVFD